jgi:hypothetical protein
LSCQQQSRRACCEIIDDLFLTDFSGLCSQICRCVVSSANTSSTKVSKSVAPDKHSKNAIVQPSSSTIVAASTEKAEKISKAMKAYLEHAKAHGESFMWHILLKLHVHCIS